MNNLKIRILIIEDNIDDQFFIRKALDNEGYELKIIPSGLEALHFLRNHETWPDVVLLDNMLPELNGLDILEKIPDSRNFGFIFLTVDNSIDTVLQAMKLGALDFIVKSASLREELPGKVKKVYEIHKARMEKKKIESELIKAKAAAEENEQKYRTLLEATSEAIIMADKGTILEVNRRTVEMTGYSYKELQDQHLSLFIQDVSSGEDMPDRIQRGESTECQGLKKDGTPFTMLIRSMETIFRGRFVALYSIRDITESRELENQLRHSEKMGAIGQLAGGIAHDFNNQLGPIMNYAEMIHDHIDHPRYKKFAKNIVLSAQRSADLTTKLLSYARKGQVHLEPLKLHSLIQETLELFERTIDKKIQIVTALSPQEIMVRADSSQLENALLNLLLNARDSMPDGGEIHIMTEIGDGPSEKILSSQDDECSSHVSIGIKDTGVGIPDDVKKRVFEPFFTTKKKGSGSGMGLASVYGTVIEHGGAIDFESRKGEGTEFTIVLPYDRELKAPDALEEDSSYDAISECSILVVDDNAMIRNVLTALLESENHKVQCCSNGRDALTLYKKQMSQIDLVILDIIMPVMGGYETYMELKKINPDIRVIVSSGYHENNESAKLRAEGVSGFIRKPFETALLLKTLREVMEISPAGIYPD